jgi:apolipoprotein N-acyltransferase
VVGPWRFAPSICFESVVSHLIRDSVNELAARGEEPDVLVNLTDDGWFYGAAVLDFHLASNVIRAVENRKPVIVAANTGLSAFIDATGKIRQLGPRRDRKVLVMTVPVTGANSPYRTVGDWPALTLAAVCVIAILTRRRGRGWLQRRGDATDD